MKNIISQLMKTMKFLPLTLLFIAVFAVISCVQDDDYDIPIVEVIEPNIEANTTISIIKSMYTSSLVDFTEASNGGELIMEGYVVSNDEAGNFYKVLILQDAPENPTAAIQLDVDVTALYAQYKPGRKVYVKLNGLGMDNLNGVLHIGAIQGTSVGRISAANYTDFIIRSGEIATMVPKLIAPADYSDNYINMLVQIDNMQLSLPEVGLPYGNASDTFTVNRNLKNCDDESSTIIRNSGFAAFKNELFPTGSGSLVAVFSKYNSDYQIFIRDTNDIDFNGERCDPPLLECTGTSGGNQVIFDENFEGTTEAILTSEGWINVNVNAGTYKYSLRSFSGNSYMQTTAYNSNENPYEAWLITPAINLDASTSEQLTFKTNVGYYNGDALSVYVSTDFTGNAADISDATWLAVDATLPQGPTSGYGTTFTDSGAINVSCLEGNMYVAFKYLGSSTGITTTFQVDDVKVTGN